MSFLIIKQNYYSDKRIVDVGIAGAMCHQFLLSIANEESFVEKRDVCFESIKSFGGIILSDTSLAQIEDAFNDCINLGLIGKEFDEDGFFIGYSVSGFEDVNEIALAELKKRKRLKQKEAREKKEKVYSNEVIDIVQYLEKMLFVFKPDRKPVNTKQRSQWARVIDAMIRLDKRTPDRIKTLIKWIYTEDEFWGPNIQSAKKLREHFDRIEVNMQKAGWKSAINVPEGLNMRQGETVIDAINRHDRDNLAPKHVISKWRREISSNA